MSPLSTSELFSGLKRHITLMVHSAGSAIFPPELLMGCHNTAEIRDPAPGGGRAPPRSVRLHWISAYSLDVSSNVYTHTERCISSTQSACNPEAMAGCVPESARSAQTLPLRLSAEFGCAVTSPLFPEGAAASHNNKQHEVKSHSLLLLLSTRVCTEPRGVVPATYKRHLFTSPSCQ